MNQDAELYSRKNEVQTGFAKNCLARLKPRSNSYPYVMDIGCGTGEVTNILLQSLPGVEKLVAYDSNQRMVNFSKANHPNDRIEYVLADAEDPATMRQEWTGLFNMVTSFTVLHWIKDQQIALDCISKVLSPGGEFLLFIALSHNFKEISMKLLEDPKWKSLIQDDPAMFPPWMRRPDWKHPHRWGDDPVKVYSNLIHSAGLQTIEVDIVVHEFESDRSFKDSLEGALFIPEAIPKSMTADLMDDVLSIVKESERKYFPDGEHELSETFLYVHGMKQG